MKRKVVWLVVSCLMVAALVLGSCAPAVVEEEKVAPPTGEPQYGGTFTIVRWMMVNTDPYRYEHNSARIMSLAYEKLGTGDWTIDREVFGFPSEYVPIRYFVGNIAESWETPDTETIIWHIRKGVYYHNKPPANGRELTAADVVWNFKRYMGSPFVERTFLDSIDSVEQLDKWTVEMKINLPIGLDRDLLRGIMDRPTRLMIAPESVGPSGEVEDWRLTAGTGPFMLEDYVPGSSLTFERNPDYWKYDAAYPENQLPYFDRVKVLLIQDQATTLSALRVGKSDVHQELTWSEFDSIKDTVPDLQSRSVPRGSPRVFKARWDHEPFTDVRVRRALNMAIDRDAIGDSYMGGYYLPYTSGIYAGWPWYTPYEELPAEVKQWHVYDPEGARQLLTEAGYPNGFKTWIDTAEVYGPGLAEILQAYLKDIGIEAEIRVHERGAFNAMRYSQGHEQIILHWVSGYSDPLQMFDQWSTPTHKFNLAAVNDPVFNAMYAEAEESFDAAFRDEMRHKMDMYALDNAFNITLPSDVYFIAWQPWLKGYSGEFDLGHRSWFATWRHVWIDQELKEAMGH